MSKAKIWTKDEFRIAMTVLLINRETLAPISNHNRIATGQHDPELAVMLNRHDAEVATYIRGRLDVLKEGGK